MEVVYGVPAVALADPFEPPARPRLSRDVCRAVLQMAVLIRRLLAAANSFTDWRQEQTLLFAAVDQAGQLADLLAASTTPIPPEAMTAPNPIGRYFGIRSAVATTAQVAAQEAAIVARGLSDLACGLIDINDIIAELKAIQIVLDDFAYYSVTPETAGDTNAPSASRYRLSGTGLQRWIIGHHMYFMFNVRAAATIHQALRVLNQGDEAEAVRGIEIAVAYVRGFTAAMAHASTVSAAYYQEQVRPTMTLPNTPVPLTGRMHKEHHAFRSALTRLLSVLPEPYPVLNERAPKLASAREALLEADLVDIERHTVLAEALVGSDRSLVQRHARDNAVSTLRYMRLLRAAQYCPFVQFGDHAAVLAASQLRRGAAEAGLLDEVKEAHP